MKVSEIVHAIQRLAPEEWAYTRDRVGLSVGSPDDKVTSVLVTLTVTPDALKAARREKAQMIVSHHPLIWTPLTALRTDDPATRFMLDIAQAGIACYAAHTNLDVAPGGVNDILAKRLGLSATKPLLPVPQADQVKLVTYVPEDRLPAVRDAVCKAGAGVIGGYTSCTFSTPGTGTFLPGKNTTPFSGEKQVLNEEPERRFETLVPKARLASVLAALQQAHPYEEVAYDIVCLENRDPALGLGVRGQLPDPTTLGAFARHACAALDIPHARVSGPLDKPVKTIAVLGGAGGGEIANVPGGIDVLLTGDLKYHEALAALDKGLAVVDAGHAGTEKWIVPALTEYLANTFDGLKVAGYVEPDVFSLVLPE